MSPFFHSFVVVLLFKSCWLTGWWNWIPHSDRQFFDIGRKPYSPINFVYHSSVEFYMIMNYYYLPLGSCRLLRTHSRVCYSGQEILRYCNIRSNTVNCFLSIKVVFWLVRLFSLTPYELNFNVWLLLCSRSFFLSTDYFSTISPGTQIVV